MFYKKGDLPEITPRVDLKTKVSNSITSAFTPTGCDSGIKRFTNGTSNSIEAYEAAMKAG